METLLITRIVFGILIVPLLLIVAAIGVVVLFFIALTVHPAIALLVIVAGVSMFVAVGRWEAARARRELPPEDRK